MSNGQGTFRNRKRFHRSMPTATLLSLAVAIPGTSSALDVDYEIGVGAKHSDNITLSETNEISETVVYPLLRFEAEQDGPRVQMAAIGDAQYRHYIDDTFDDELRGSLAGKLNWTIVPERVDFVVQDYLSRQPVNDLEPVTPNNEQQANVFIAGPSFYARFNSTTRGQLDLRYTNSYAEENDAFNGDRYDGAIRLRRELSATQAVSGNLEAVQTEFDDLGAASDYRAYNAYVGYEAQWRVIDADIDLGYARLEPRNNGENESSALVRASFDWRASPRSLLSADLRHQLTDATQTLIAPSIDLDRRIFNDLRYLDVSLRPNPFRERFARVRYQFTSDRLTAQVAPYYRRVRYLDDVFEDQDRRGVLLNLEYRLRPRLDLSVLAVREDRKYIDLARTDEDTGFSIGLSNRFSRHLTGRIDFQRLERDSDAIGRSYDANAVVVTFTWRR